MMTAKGLAKLAEELGELSTVVGKKLAFFHTDEHPDGAGSLKKRMEEEMGDVIAAIDLVATKLKLDTEYIHARASKKRETFRAWDESAEKGQQGFDRD